MQVVLCVEYNELVNFNQQTIQLSWWSLVEKMSTLKIKPGDLNFPDIVYKMNIDGQPVPIIQGTGIRVQTIVIAVDEWKDTPAYVAQQYNLPEGLIKEALAFYSAHKMMVDALIQLDEDAENKRA